ncbi:MAG: lipopolysaccharide heptosyltransferase II [Deltaproteobacteria bacterium]|jgi:heptosyltransferase-2|nr:lipopolysaccharide heptosyltransferase II [Deltaproteobacteria bacterium]
MSFSVPDRRPKKILVRSTNWIGDAIMTTPAVRSIRENFPEAHITMLAYPWVADVFRASPHVDEIIIYDAKGIHKGLKGLLRLASALKKQNFDCAIILQNAFKAAFLAWLARIPIRAGYRRDGRALFLRPGIKIRPEVRGMHQVHYYQYLLEALGLRCGPDELFLAHTPEDARWARAFKEKVGGKALLGINPGAAFGPAKCWPAERYGELCARLHEEFGLQAVVFGTKADAATIATIVAHGPHFITGLAGKTTLGQAMALIGQCDAFVTNDSGLMHVGAAVQIPLVAIFGSSVYLATGPYSPKAVVVKKKLECQPCLQRECQTDFRCMMHIEVEDVAAPLRQMLAGG